MGPCSAFEADEVDTCLDVFSFDADTMTCLASAMTTADIHNARELTETHMLYAAVALPRAAEQFAALGLDAEQLRRDLGRKISQNAEAASHELDGRWATSSRTGRFRPSSTLRRLLASQLTAHRTDTSSGIAFAQLVQALCVAEHVGGGGESRRQADANGQHDEPFRADRSTPDRSTPVRSTQERALPPHNMARIRDDSAMLQTILSAIRDQGERLTALEQRASVGAPGMGQKNAHTSPVPMTFHAYDAAVQYSAPYNARSPHNLQAPDNQSANGSRHQDLPLGDRPQDDPWAKLRARREEATASSSSNHQKQSMDARSISGSHNGQRSSLSESERTRWGTTQRRSAEQSAAGAGRSQVGCAQVSGSAHRPDSRGEYDSQRRYDGASRDDASRSEAGTDEYRSAHSRDRPDRERHRPTQQPFERDQQTAENETTRETQNRDWADRQWSRFTRREHRTSVEGKSNGSEQRFATTNEQTRSAQNGWTARTSRHDREASRSHPSAEANRETLADRDTENEKRFYLNLDDDVVDAPSIGPKTAARLYPVGIHTVRDLLQVNVIEAAQAIDARHITSEVLTDWQDQARLVCTIPWLRGTHAQLLVGSGHRTVQAIQASTSGDIQSAIATFAVTKAGERILRNGPPPADDKIAGWIENAEHAEPNRSL
ncbi:MAG: DUF4332 domain-containing protein [Pseudomonadota bacterium]